MLCCLYFLSKNSGSAGPKSKRNREGRSSDASQANSEARTSCTQPKCREEPLSDAMVDEKQSSLAPFPSRPGKVH